MSKRILAAMLLFCLLVQSAQAQDSFTTYFPIITKGNGCELMSDPILRVTDGTTVIDLLGSGSGWELSDPYWQPQIAQFKGGGAFVDSGLAEGKQLVHKEYDNVIETIPLSVTGIDQGAAIQTIRDLLQLGRQSSDYWTESYEYDDVWLEVKPACANSLTGYSRIVKMSIPELKNPFGQPFFSAYVQPVMEDLTLIIEREPFWRGTPPGEMIGPLTNFVNNADFELWSNGIADSHPDSWTDIESLWITGTNDRFTDKKFGDYSLRVKVTGSTAANAFKGVSQTLENTIPKATYTAVAWVRSDGVSNGVGRILLTYGDQKELYRGSTKHGWTLYADTFILSPGATIAIACEILTTAANTDGTFYVDGLMILEGDWLEEAQNNTLPYLSNSHIINHFDQVGNAIVGEGHINWVDSWNIPGDVDPLIRLDFQNITPPADENNPVEVYGKIRVGLRRTKDVSAFDNICDPVGVVDATCSGGDRVNLTGINASWRQVASKTVKNTEVTQHNLGRFRAFARIYDTIASGASTLVNRLNYSIGTDNINRTYLDEVTSPVVSQWHIVDLTPNKAVVVDVKNSNVVPKQLVYNLEMKRGSGTNDARLDYFELMPTDGGYMEFDLNPSLLYQNNLVMDWTGLGGTNMSISGARTGLKLIATFAGEYQIRDFGIYKDTLYIPTDNGLLYTYKDGVLTQVYDGSVLFGSPLYLEEYAGKLFIIGGNKLYETDGQNFPGTFRGNTGAGTVRQLKSFAGKLWIAMSGGSLYDWDGSAIHSRATGEVNIWDLEVFGNQLYVGTSGNAKVFRYNQTTDNFTLSHDFSTYGPTAVFCLKTYQDRLYAGLNGGTNKVWRFDGLTWEATNTPLAHPNFQTAGDLEVVNDKLYAATGSVSSPIWESDGMEWEQIYDAQTYLFWTLANYQGNLYAGTFDVAPADALLYSVVFDEDSYSVPTFQGRTLSPPPREQSNEKRHRYFFLYDRPNYINNTTDKALISIGFVPRYLSLINYNPQ